MGKPPGRCAWTRCSCSACWSSDGSWEAVISGETRFEVRGMEGGLEMVLLVGVLLLVLPRMMSEPAGKKTAVAPGELTRF